MNRRNLTLIVIIIILIIFFGIEIIISRIDKKIHGKYMGYSEGQMNIVNKGVSDVK